MLFKTYDALNGKKVILLYSGGLDTVYMALKLREHGANVFAVKVLIGENIESVRRAKEIAANIDIPYIEVDRVDEFVGIYLQTALLNGHYVDNLYPISASISFPMIAKAGIDMAASMDADAICHGSDVYQNSMSRFNRSITFLAPNLGIAALGLIDETTREQKQKYLQKLGIDTSNCNYSIDENLWCSCIEGGNFDSPETVADFTSLTGKEEFENPKCPFELILSFDNGIPYAIDGKTENLKTIITNLHSIGAKYELGRFVSWEDTLLFKSRELRFAPAAEILYTALTALINSTFSVKEKEVKNSLATIWHGLVLKGDWYCDLANSITAFNRSLCHRLTGKVVLRFVINRSFVVAVNSPYLQKNIQMKTVCERTLMQSTHILFTRLP